MTPPPAAPATPAGVAARPVAERRPGLPVPLLAGAALLVLLLAGVGFVVGHSGSKAKAAPKPPAARSVSKGGVSIPLPAGWSSAAAQTIPGLALTSPGAAAPAARASGTLVWGQAHGVWPHYLPASFVARLKSNGVVDRRQVVKIGKADAFRYVDVGVKGLAKPVNVYVAPQAGRTKTFVCLKGASSFARSCESAVAGAKIAGTGFALTPSSSYAAAVTRAVKTAGAGRASGIRAMKAAKIPAKQAPGARTVAAAYSSAGGAVRKATSSPFLLPANKRIVVAFSSASSAYRKLAAAAVAKSNSRYAAARREATRAEATLQKSLAGLGDVGFTVR